jgi:hypothetical protein
MTEGKWDSPGTSRAPSAWWPAALGGIVLIVVLAMYKLIVG